MTFLLLPDGKYEPCEGGELNGYLSQEQIYPPHSRPTAPSCISAEKAVRHPLTPAVRKKDRTEVLCVCVCVCASGTKKKPKKNC